jgi:hypothetical protein
MSETRDAALTEHGRYICTTQLERDTWIIREKKKDEPNEEDDMVHLDVVERVLAAERAALAEKDAEIARLKAELQRESPTDVAQRIGDYLYSGGLFNPELARHYAVRDLLIDARHELFSLSAERDAAYTRGEAAGLREGFIGGLQAAYNGHVWRFDRAFVCASTDDEAFAAFLAQRTEAKG